MAVFNWTYASWDKIRPTLLPSTGFGQTLKLYEKEKAELEAMKTHDFIDPFSKAVTALLKADKAREEVIKKCGNNPLFKSAKKVLTDAKVDVERTVLKNLLNMSLEKLLKEVSKPVSEEVIRYKTMLDLAKTTESKLRQVVKQVEKLDKETASNNVNFALTMEEQNIAKAATNGENNFQPGQTFSEQKRYAQLVRSKSSVLKSSAPSAMAKWEQLFTIMDKFADMQNEYQQTASKIAQIYNPYALD